MKSKWDTTSRVKEPHSQWTSPWPHLRDLSAASDSADCTAPSLTRSLPSAFPPLPSLGSPLSPGAPSFWVFVGDSSSAAHSFLLVFLGLLGQSLFYICSATAISFFLKILTTIHTLMIPNSLLCIYAGLISTCLLGTTRDTSIQRLQN